MFRDMDQQPGLDAPQTKPPIFTRREVLKLSSLTAVSAAALAACSEAPPPLSDGNNVVSHGTALGNPEVQATPEIRAMDVPWSEIQEGNTFDDLIQGWDKREGHYAYIGKSIMISRGEGSIQVFLGTEAVIAAQVNNIFGVNKLNAGEKYYIANSEQMLTFLGQHQDLQNQINGFVRSEVSVDKDKVVTHQAIAEDRARNLRLSMTYVGEGWSTNQMFSQDNWELQQLP